MTTKDSETEKILYKLMKREHLKDNFLSFFLAVIIVLGLICIAIFIPKHRTEEVSSTVYRVQSDMTVQTNEYRESKGLTTLTENYKLNKSAQVKSAKLCSTGEWSHNAGGVPFYIDIDNQGYIYKESGENLARGYQDAKEALEAFVDSPTHLENVVGEYEEIGVGYTECNGKHYYAVHYGKQ